MTTIIITPEDVEAAQAKQDIVLTDCNHPLELLCTAYDVQTYNEREEYNWEYISEQKQYIIDNNLSYEKIFLAQQDQAKRLFYVDNLEQYGADLASYTEAQKELLKNEDGDLYEEYVKEEQEMYTGLWKERLHGDYRNDGAIELLQTKMTRANNNYDVELAYDENNQTATITIDEEDEEDRWSKGGFIKYLVSRVVSLKKQRHIEAEQRKQEREENAKRAAERKEREKQKKREKILQA